MRNSIRSLKAFLMKIHQLIFGLLRQTYIQDRVKLDVFSTIQQLFEVSYKVFAIWLKKFLIIMFCVFGTGFIGYRRSFYSCPQSLNNIHFCIGQRIFFFCIFKQHEIFCMQSALLKCLVCSINEFLVSVSKATSYLFIFSLLNTTFRQDVRIYEMISEMETIQKVKKDNSL